MELENWALSYTSKDAPKSVWKSARVVLGGMFTGVLEVFEDFLNLLGCNLRIR